LASCLAQEFDFNLCKHQADFRAADLDMVKCMKGQSMLHCMHALEEAGKAFGTKKLQDLHELGMRGPANALCLQ